MARNWYYSRDGQSQGPVPEEQLRAMVANGVVRGEDLVWAEGLAAWTPLRQVPELAPPPPPAAVYTPPAAPVPAPVYAPAPAPAPRPAPAPAPYVAPVAVQPAVQGAVSPEAVEALRRTKPWVRFLAVLGFIGLAFLLLGALAVIVLSALGSAALPGFGGAMGFIMGGVYLVIALIQFPPVIFLNRYASRIGDLTATESSEDLEAALGAQKSFWKFVGVFTLVMIILYVLAIVAAVVLGATAGSGLLRR
ncbi:MAG: DUF4339 domain-containing protein [Acidobacteria bacterium]|nr:DUF4339 domain-containing protein [Acidobacteriota bacterium]